MLTDEIEPYTCLQMSYSSFGSSLYAKVSMKGVKMLSKGVHLTHFSRMNFPFSIGRTSPFLILGVLGGIFIQSLIEPSMSKQWRPPGGTLIFTYIRRLGSLFWVQNFEYQDIFFGFQKNEYFGGYKDFVDIFGVITKLGYI